MGIAYLVIILKAIIEYILMFLWSFNIKFVQVYCSYTNNNDNNVWARLGYQYSRPINNRIRYKSAFMLFLI